MSAADASRANANRAREAMAAKRAAAKRPKGSQENENRVSPRSLEKVQNSLAAAEASISVLTERTNSLEHQRDARGQTALRQKRSAEEAHKALAADHLLAVTELQKTITDLESRLSSATSTISELRAKLKASEMRLSRFETAREGFCARAITQAVQSATTLRLKESGRYTDSIRDLIANLVCLAKVPTEHVSMVIQLVADTAGLTLQPARMISDRTIGRTVREAGLASELQVAECLNAENGEFPSFCTTCIKLSHRI